MTTYWYGSQDKLEALGATQTGLLGRLQTKLKLGLGGAGVELGVSPRATRSLDNAVATAERQLNRLGEISDLSSGPPATVYFKCGGPACRSVISGMFWVAAVDGDAAVLLVGSAANAIAAQRSKPDDVFSPSADPVGAVRHLLASTPDLDRPRVSDEAGHADENHPDSYGGDLAYAWRALLARQLDLVDDDIDGLPRIRSISQYVAHRRYQPQGEGWQRDIRWLIMGTPVYVSQVAKTG